MLMARELWDPARLAEYRAEQHEATRDLRQSGAPCGTAPPVTSAASEVQAVQAAGTARARALVSCMHCHRTHSYRCRHTTLAWVFQKAAEAR